jgi:hypothetical protein
VDSNALSSAGVTHSLEVLLFRAQAGSNVFTALDGSNGTENTVTRTSGLSGAHPAEPFLNGFKSNIQATFTAGQRLAIGGRLHGTGYSSTLSVKCYFTGGIGLILDS